MGKLCLFIAMCSFPMKHYGQAWQGLWEGLIQAELVEESQKEDFTQWVDNLQEKETSNIPNSSIIKYLSSLAIDKMYPEREKENAGWTLYFSKPNPDVLGERIGKIHQELTLLLGKLRSAKLISPQIFKRYTLFIDENEYSGEAHMLVSLEQAAILDEALAPKSIFPLVEKLSQSAFIPSKEVEALKERIEKGDIESYTQLFSYIPHSLSFPYSTNRGIALDELKAIYPEIAALIPGFAFEGLEISLEVEQIHQGEEDKEGVKRVFANLSTTYQGSLYSYKCSYGYQLDSEPLDSLNGSIEGGECYSLFNEVLLGIQSPYRVYGVKFTRPREPDPLLGDLYKEVVVEGDKLGILVAQEEELRKIKVATEGYFRIYGMRRPRE